MLGWFHEGRGILNKGVWGSPQQERTWDIQVHACHPGIRAFFRRSSFSELFKKGGEKVNSEDQKKLQKNRPGTFIRLSEDEQNRLDTESLILGKSVPTLLRDSYFNRLPTKPLIDNEGTKSILAQLGRIGNNINQLAKNSNRGLPVLKSDLAPIEEQLSLILQYITRSNGVCKNQNK